MKTKNRIFSDNLIAQTDKKTDEIAANIPCFEQKHPVFQEKTSDVFTLFLLKSKSKISDFQKQNRLVLRKKPAFFAEDFCFVLYTYH